MNAICVERMNDVHSVSTTTTKGGTKVKSERTIEQAQEAETRNIFLLPPRAILASITCLSAPYGTLHGIYAAGAALPMGRFDLGRTTMR